MLLARTSFRICSRNAFALTDPLPRKKMARSMMIAKVIMETTRLTYISVAASLGKLAGPCFSCLLGGGKGGFEIGLVGVGGGWVCRRRLGSSWFLAAGNYFSAAGILSVWPGVSRRRRAAVRACA